MAVANLYLRKNWKDWKREMENRRNRWRERTTCGVYAHVSDEEEEDVEEESEDVENNEEDVNVDGEENEEDEKRHEAKKEETDGEGGSNLEKRCQEKKNEDQEEDGKMSEGDRRGDTEEREDEEKLVNKNGGVREGEEDWGDEEEKFDADEKEEKNNDTKREAEENEDDQEQMVEDIQFQDDDDEHQEQLERYHLEEELTEQISSSQVENIWQNQESRRQDVKCEEGSEESAASSKDSETASMHKAENQYIENHDEDSAAPEDPDEKSQRNEDGIFEVRTVGRNEKDRSEKSRDDEETATESWESQTHFHDDKDIQEESVDKEEAECSADEGKDYDEDEVKIYCKDDHPVNIFHTLSEFRESSLLTDLTLQTADGLSFHVHSPVLAAVSSLIWKNLSRSKVESRTDERIHINISAGVRVWSVSLGPEVDRVGLEAVVEFAYSGLISCLNKHNLEQIKVAAQSLGVPRVLDLCAKEEERVVQNTGDRKKEKTSAAQQLMISLQSIKQLWMDRVGCDVILETLDGSLHVHRVILAAGNDYFRGMFTLGMKESNQPCVSLPFLLSSELEALVDSSYSGTLHISWTCVFEITSTALQLQYQPALSLCLNFLHQEINPHTCLDVVSFAEAYGIKHLLEVANDFVLLQFQKVAATSKFKDLPAEQLFKYLNSHSLCVLSELVVFNAVVVWIQAKPK